MPTGTGSGPLDMEGSKVRAINMITQLLLVLAGLNAGTTTLFDTNVVSLIFGELAVPIYVLMGVSALWQLVPLFRQERVQMGSKAAQIRSRA